MNRPLPWMVLLMAAAAAGCQLRSGELAHVPPPPDLVAVDFEPVEVTPVQAAPPGPVAYETIREVGDERTHVVRKGETLYSISRQYYGSGRRVRDIVLANGITNPNKIVVGQKLLLPD